MGLENALADSFEIPVKIFRMAGKKHPGFSPGILIMHGFTKNFCHYALSLPLQTPEGIEHNLYYDYNIMQLSWCQGTTNRGDNISKTPTFKVSIIPTVRQYTRTFPVSVKPIGGLW